MKILIGCEESQAVCKEFRKLGHEAYSCDIQECSGGHPEWHLHMDVMEVIQMNGKDYWDMIILHPVCTKMSLSGNRHYGKGKPRHQERIDALHWTVELWEMAKFYAPKVGMENPTSVLFTELRKYGAHVQYIQPYEFGHMETKKTGFALHNLPDLVGTDDVYDEMMKLPPKERNRIWYMSPGENRGKERSKTYVNIAKAIAEQWGTTHRTTTREEMEAVFASMPADEREMLDLINCPPMQEGKSHYYENLIEQKEQ